MNKIKLIGGLLALFVSMPIWFYLVHWMLKTTGAGELQMFLFWIYLPASLLIHLLTAIASASEK